MAEHLKFNTFGTVRRCTIFFFDILIIVRTSRINPTPFSLYVKTSMCVVRGIKFHRTLSKQQNLVSEQFKSFVCAALRNVVSINAERSKRRFQVVILCYF